MVQRARTGEGQRIDVALMDCMLNLLVYELQEAQFSKPMARPTYGPVRASDGDLLIAPVSARNFAALRDLTGLPELSIRPEVQIGVGARRELDCDDAGDRKMDRATDGRPNALRRSSDAGIPSAHFRDPAEALDDPDLADRGTFAPIADAAGEFQGRECAVEDVGREKRDRTGNSVGRIPSRRCPCARARAVC